MKNRSIIATLFFVILCVAVVSTHPRAAYAQEKNYYLTKTTVQGNKVLTSCASGYHVASIVELSDLSHLHYLTTYAGAYNLPPYQDQGDGPPPFYLGWVRSMNDIVGLGSCGDWTINLSSSNGIVGYVDGSYDSTTAQVQVYVRYLALSCDNKAPVWCIQNP